VIGFIGSVFSPWYKWSGRRDPQDHCCINVATYGPGGRFTMTDRGRPALRQSRDRLQVGPSSMHWTGHQLVITVDEIGALPMVTPVRGTITLTPQAMTEVEVALTPEGRHLWRPFAPSCRIEVALSQGHEWTGHGYFDANFGTAALEADFLEAALQGFQHVLTLTDIIRIRLPAFGGAVRAAARLGDRDRLSNLEDAAISEAERANTPFEVASFYLSASEAWLAVPDRRMADRRLQRVNALVQEHQFHELSMRADALRARLQMATAPAGGRQQSVWPSATAGAWDEETVINGIHRLTCLPT